MLTPGLQSRPVVCYVTRFLIWLGCPGGARATPLFRVEYLFWREWERGLITPGILKQLKP